MPPNTKIINDAQEQIGTAVTAPAGGVSNTTQAVVPTDGNQNLPKVVDNLDGTYTPIVQTTAASGGTVTANQGTPNAGGAQAWPVAVIPALPAGTNAIGTVALNTALPAGANAIGTVALNAAVPAGANVIGGVTAADGALTTVGAIADVSVVGDVNGTLSAKLRGLSRILSAVWVQARNSLQTEGVGVAGIPAGGVLSVQGVAGGTSVPTASPNAIDLQDDGAGETISAAGTVNKADITVTGVSSVGVLIFVSALSGTGPTIQFNVQVKDVNGNYRTIASTTALSSAPAQATLSLGPGSNSFNGVVPGSIIRLSIVTAGTVFTSSTFTYQVFGR